MADIELAADLDYLFDPPGTWDYKVTYGGRGGVKSWGYARALLLKGVNAPLRVLCAREYQNSIKESVHHLLQEQMDLMGLGSYYRVQDQQITGHLGTEFIFSGIKTNPLKIKSMEGIDICWVEEAEAVSNASWDILIPTIRKPGSEIWVTFNTGEESDPTYQRFVVSPPPRCITKKVVYLDNPWLSEKMRREAEYRKEVDPEGYLNIWMGEPKLHGNAKVLRGKCISTWFEPGPDWDGPYFGNDHGFAEDPMTLMKCWIYKKKLYIEKEVWGRHVELDDIAPLWMREIPEAQHHIIRSDRSRPETISHVRQRGFPKLMAAEQWPGSVEDGVAFLRMFEQIVIHPSCTNAYEESKQWSYKTDRLTGDVLPALKEGNDHCWDAVRYALEPIIKQSKLGLLNFYEGIVAAKQQQAA